MMINEAKKYINANKETKFRLMDYYNKFCYPYVASNRMYKIQYSDNWCAMFTTVIAQKCGLKNAQFPYEVSVYYQVQWAKKAGKFFTDVSKVKPNDLIIYDWDRNGVLDHVGIVISVTGGVISVIEGNKNDTVAYRSVPSNSNSIHGFIQIDIPKEFLTPKQEKERIADLARDTVAGKYGNGVARMQSLGTDYRAVQDYINVMYK